MTDAIQFAEWLRTFHPLSKENNQWVLESQVSSEELHNHFLDFKNSLSEATADANNVKSVTWSIGKSQWFIEYKNGLPSDYVSTENVIDFLYNA